MSTDRVQFSIGPVPSDMALAWIANARCLVGAVRDPRAEISIDVREQILEVLEVLLDIWEGCAKRSETFRWSTDTDRSQVLYLVREWVEIGSLSDEELERIGCTWAPEWTRPFADALVAGATEALRAVGDDGAALRARLTGEQD